MKNQEVKKSMETKENESGYLQPCHSRLTAQDRICPADSSSRKAMNLNETEDAPSSERRILGGIGESRNRDSESGYLQSCHSRLDRESRNRDSESGRSMVEMLGVLAIMGVLAIGGIAGYRWAMDKYNANEILNEVRKRAVTASQQRILGHAINLSEYGDNTIQGHAVTTADSYNGDTNFFTITVQGIEQNICDKVLAETIPFAIDTWVGVDSDECVGENNDITFAFANTLDSGATLSESESTIPAWKECTNSCTSPATCVNGYCQCPGEKQIWNPSEVMGEGNCVEVTGDCANNTDCKDKNGNIDTTKYCQIEAGYASSETSCYKNYRGTCTALDAGNKAGTYNGHPFLRSGTSMTWWSARNWCQAHNRKLTSLSDLGITGGYEDGYCKSDCQFKTGLSWSGLQEALGSGYSDWADDSESSCYAFGVKLGGGSLGGNFRISYGRALCADGSSSGGNPNPETTAAMTTEEIALTEMATASSSFNGSSEYTVSGSDGIWSTEPESFSSSGSSEYTVSGSDGIWGTGTAIQGKSCSSNEECVDDTGMPDETQYCNIVNYTWTGSPDACYTNLRGTCRDKGDALTDTNSINIKDDVSGKTLMTVWKGPIGTWWSARNWCAAHKKRLISVSELQCDHFHDGSSYGICCKDSGTCSATASTQSEIMQALRKAYGSGDLPVRFWTATPYNSTSDNSCNAFYVILSNGCVSSDYYGNRYNDTLNSALCE